MQDVANLAGVGKVTVSYVLNGRSRTARISEETEQKVLRAAEELSYRPNALARSLAMQRTDLLAVVFQRGSFFTAWSSFSVEVMRGVSSAAVDLGYDLMLHTKDVAPEQEGDVLADGRVDGALILRDHLDPLDRRLCALGLPSVRFFTRSNEPTQPFVDSDNYSGGRLATRHLIELGHRRIGMVRGAFGSTSSNDRFNGYRDALESAGIGVAMERVITVASGVADIEPFQRLMAQPDRPTALFVWSDEIAFILMQQLRAMGMEVPRDVSLVGFDSLTACERTDPPLTSVRQSIFEMAQVATRLLVSIIRNEPVERRQIVYPLTLDVRGSTAPPKQ
jgi:DNA-binding LacI/PurR family transcriptional regulator